MAKVVTPDIATVEVIGRAKQSNYSDDVYHPCLFTLASGGQIWKSLNQSEASQLSKGDRVQLVPAGTDSKGNTKHNIVRMENPPNAVTTEAVGLSTQEKQAIATYIQQQAKVLRYCYESAAGELGSLELSEESIRASAHTLYLAASKHFKL
ncbi:hypothetical protein [Pseudanabaena sp. PCC 6802]|uniref:hypothetical protein n=1 Tax=Pseudanabaena sp. PCC 6802 TaxID=118173 RepID=UPI0003472AD7|nr:hypothetical protein [Pseudanabaena sp. PCC 6802]